MGVEKDKMTLRKSESFETRVCWILFIRKMFLLQSIREKENTGQNAFEHLKQRLQQLVAIRCTDPMPSPDEDNDFWER